MIKFFLAIALLSLSLLLLCTLFFLICLPGILFLEKKFQKQNRKGDSEGKGQ